MFIDAWHDKTRELIHVAERVNGKRVLREYPAHYIFYYPDSKGKFTDIGGRRMTRVIVSNAKAFDKEKRVHYGKRLCESDYSPVNRCLEENYKGQEAPELHVAYFDIEVAYDRVKGFAETNDPFNPITAITTHLGWLDRTVTFVVKPKDMTDEVAADIIGHFEDTILCKDDVELLELWFGLIEDADVLSGWNSEGYDIPYVLNRCQRVLSRDHTRQICLWDQYPKKREFEKYGKTLETYDPIGRVHLDYLELYRKYNYHEMHSYSLDSIAEYELGERKVPYEGTLDQLYNNDFEKFIAYNRQDVTLLKKLDAKLKFMNLTNLISHANNVGLRATLGAVAVTDQAVINEAHDQGLVVPDRPPRNTEDFPAAGAYVAVPVTGMHEWIGSMDINSLYPSVIRALNMSTETIIGQVRQTRTNAGIQEFIDSGKGVADYWDGKFACAEYESVMARDPGQLETVDWSDGTSTEMTSAEIYDFVFHSGQPLMISGNGTIFSYANKGIIPGLLERWYAERKELQKKAKEATTPEDFEYWDKRQLVKKINLNSAYGALLNAGSRFFDQRLGQSTTLCGRLIARHMAGAVNEMFTGIKDHRGESIIYGDTDSEIGSTVHQTNFGEKTIEELFLSCAEFWQDGDKEYGYHSDLMVMSYDPETNEPYFGHIDYIYRHRVSKDLYEIEDALGNVITVTEDHSVMVERDGNLVETKPAHILDTDILISIKIGDTGLDNEQPNNKKQFKEALKHLILSDSDDPSELLNEVRLYLSRMQPPKKIVLNRAPVKSVKKIGKADNEYVYDIGMQNLNKPWYFGNNILIHNSVYFSAYPLFKDKINSGELTWTPERVIEIYDTVSEQVNETFPAFMTEAFNCPRTQGEVIRAGREVVAVKGIYMTKKRYAVLIIDKEGKRKDINGSSGEIKAMGLEMKRSDTPEFMQRFLEEVLLMTLEGQDQRTVMARVKQFRDEFKSRPGWEKGTPKRVNNLTKHTAVYKKTGRCGVGHAMAAINWNRLREAFSDRRSMEITDGQKTIVCKLKPNPLQINSIAYPIDEMHLPDWFKQLPFDHEAMEETIIDSKIQNLLGVLDWDLNLSKDKGFVDDLFD